MYSKTVMDHFRNPHNYGKMEIPMESEELEIHSVEMRW